MGAEAPRRDPAATAIDAAAAAMAVGAPELVAELLAELPLGVALYDPQLRLRYANPAFPNAAAPPDALPDAAAHEARLVLADGLPRSAAGLRLSRLAPGGRVLGLLATVAPVPPAHDRLDLLTAAGESIGTTLDIDTTCVELARFAVPRLADLATVDIMPPTMPDFRRGDPPGPLRLLRAAVGGVPALHPQLAALAHPGESVRHGEDSLAARCLAAAKPLSARLDDEEALTAALSDRAGREVYRAAGIRSLLAVPLTARGHLIGVLTLARTQQAAGPQEFGDEETGLIEDLAHRAALSIDNARRYMRSQGITLELQRALLAEPADPHPNLEIACRYLPSGTSSVVGGDWYESVRLSFGRTLLVIGDVMGHGVEAAVAMSSYRSMLRFVASTDLPPHRILRRLDTLIAENDDSRPATCLLALVDPSRRRVTFAGAGHLPPALLLPGRPTELVELPTGPPLGTGLGGYQQVVRELDPGHVLLLYTDGLVERRHEDIDASLTRLAGLPLPAEGELDDLIDAALHSSSPGDAEDDIAILAARVRPRLL